eukprot:gnl/TRDRNA2_/TRDRNA2_136482_c0_seq5.p1 gnl/TRDRNA2_/TRDRNA2_136482_c0~~gnl/TRDRNA2_/TRDRNA2_136482_c0_seq5.p1  ORF type:complete len:574 (+),score=103.40 gnl/TRDRNA2_/TRDRNA2_136482_c0_seq5:100-1821(+)
MSMPTDETRETEEFQPAALRCLLSASPPQRTGGLGPATGSRDQLKHADLSKIDDTFTERDEQATFTWSTWMILGIFTEMLIWFMGSKQMLYRKSNSGLDEGECWRAFPFPCTRWGLMLLNSQDSMLVTGCISLLIWPIVQYALFGWFKIMWGQMWCFRNWYDRTGVQPIGPAPPQAPLFKKLQYIPFWMQNLGFTVEEQMQRSFPLRLAINWLCGLSFGLIASVVFAGPACAVLVALSMSGILSDDPADPAAKQKMMMVLSILCAAVSAATWCLVQKASAHLAAWHDKSGHHDTWAFTPFFGKALREKPMTYKQFCSLMMLGPFVMVFVINIVIGSQQYKGARVHERINNEVAGGIWAANTKTLNKMSIMVPLTSFLMLGSMFMRLVEERWCTLDDVTPWEPPKEDDWFFRRLLARSREMRPVTYRPKWCDDDYATRFWFQFRTALMHTAFCWVIVKFPCTLLVDAIRSNFVTDEFDLMKQGQVATWCQMLNQFIFLQWNMFCLSSTVGPFLKYVYENPGAFKSQQWKEKHAKEALDDVMKADAAKKGEQAKSDVSTGVPSSAPGAASSTGAR